MFPETADELEGVTAVVGTEECRRFHSGPHSLCGARPPVGVELPHRDEVGSDICGERHWSCARFTPTEAAVVTHSDVGAEARVGGGGEKTSRQLCKGEYALTGQQRPVDRAVDDEEKTLGGPNSHREMVNGSSPEPRAVT